MTYSDKNEFILKPSYWLAAPITLLAIALSFVEFPYIFIFSLLRVLEIYCWKYEFNERTIVERKGIFSVERREIQYARIKSIKIDEPFIFRLVGLSNITIQSSDPYMPELVLHAIPFRKTVKAHLDARTYFWRKQEGIREFDMYKL